MNTKKVLNTKTEDLGERTIRFCISSEVVDRDGDTLIAKGCDFTNFEKNKVFLPFHNSRDFPLGKVINCWVEEKSVFADVYFPTIEELTTDKNNVSEKAKLVDFTYCCYKNGMLNAVSVGFIPKEYDQNKETGGYIISKWELLEFSAVCVPANQDAIATARKDFNNDVSFLNVKKTYEELEKELEEKTIECAKLVKECKELNAKVEKELSDEINLDEINDDVNIENINNDFDLTDL